MRRDEAARVTFNHDTSQIRYVLHPCVRPSLGVCAVFSGLNWTHAAEATRMISRVLQVGMCCDMDHVLMYVPAVRNGLFWRFKVMNRVLHLGFF